MNVVTFTAQYDISAAGSYNFVGGDSNVVLLAVNIYTNATPTFNGVSFTNEFGLPFQYYRLITPSSGSHTFDPHGGRFIVYVFKNVNQSQYLDTNNSWYDNTGRTGDQYLSVTPNNNNGLIFAHVLYLSGGSMSVATGQSNVYSASLNSTFLGGTQATGGAGNVVSVGFTNNNGTRVVEFAVIVLTPAVDTIPVTPSVSVSNTDSRTPTIFSLITTVLPQAVSVAVSKAASRVATAVNVRVIVQNISVSVSNSARRFASIFPFRTIQKSSSIWTTNSKTPTTINF